MTTQINDIHDLLRLLEARPDLAAELRQRVLTPELLGLPEQMAVLTGRVDGLAEQMVVLTGRVDGLTEQVAGLTEQMSVLTGRVDGLTRELREFIQEQRETNRRTDERLARLEELQSQGNQQLQRLDNRVADLAGEGYELRCLRRFQSLVFNQFGLVNTAVLYGGLNGPEPQFQGRMVAARREGKISDWDFRQLMAADCLAYAWDAEAEAARYLAVEMSVTLDLSDIERARERAAALGRVTEGAGWGVVISANVAEPQGAQAREAGVTVIHFMANR